MEKNAGGCRIRFLLMDIFEWKRMACFFLQEGDRKMAPENDGKSVGTFGAWGWCFEDSFLEDHVKNLPPPDFLNAWLLHAKVRQLTSGDL